MHRGAKHLADSFKLPKQIHRRGEGGEGRVRMQNSDLAHSVFLVHVFIRIRGFPLHVLNNK